jgi:hypothetical protein
LHTKTNIRIERDEGVINVGLVILNLYLIWGCGNDGVLRQTVNLQPSGLVGSNPIIPTIKATTLYYIASIIRLDISRLTRTVSPNGSVVQLVERWSPKPNVAGSSPVIPAILKKG